MASKMLIDSAHQEETRVVVVRGNRIEEFDYESASRKQLKGNIYLAKVTRVEPSLQAAFVDYGGNRHGFLAFGEIHPDYYQIPVADRQALLREEEAEARRSEEEYDRRRDSGQSEPAAQTEAASEASTQPDDVPVEEEPSGEAASEALETQPESGSAEPVDLETPVPTVSEAQPSPESPMETAPETGNGNGGGSVTTVEEEPEARTVDQVGAEDALEEVPERRRPPRRVYKIQEVIKRRQVILVQVVKEERGNKGAALTTYLSLAGRYCVLMPNTARGGGISRKITDAGDRKRLKEVARDIEVPAGMGLIVRTAGAQRTRAEIKRDYDYLMRLWESVRDLTLKSTAPSLVYEEGSLIKRAIRDLYTKDVEEIIVEGEAGYREAKDFMKMLMPSHARNVKIHKEDRPLFSRHKIDSQLDGLFSPTVTLQSGGYVVMNQTEALVSIDINSGKATREHNIEDTAVKTNLEAADEIARQLRLRDLAGLIVIDFIDMEEKRNNRAVERRLKEALKHDRARIQVGRISHFGLLEMSRQRLRRGMLEGSTRQCPACQGTGLVRSVSSCALSVLRTIEEQLTGRKPEHLTVQCNPEVAFYILNDKRDHLLSLEMSYGVSIYMVANESVSPSECEIQRVAERAGLPRRILQQEGSVKIDSAFVEPEEAPQPEPEEAPVEAEEERAAEDEDEADQRRKRRRRRGRRGGKRVRGQESEPGSTPRELELQGADGSGEAAEVESQPEPYEAEQAEGAVQAMAGEALVEETGPVEATADKGEDAAPVAPRRSRGNRRRQPEEAAAAPAEPLPESYTGNGGRDVSEPATASAELQSTGEAAPARESAQPEEPAAAPARRWNPPPATPKAEGPARTGWWRKRSNGQPQA